MQTPSTDLWRLSPRLRAIVEAELNDEEKITWIGTPIPRRYALQSIPLVLFGIAWTAFILFGVVAPGFLDFKKGFDLFVLLFCIPFVLVGFGLLSSPFWMMRNAKQIAYVLTTCRAVIFDNRSRLTIRSFGPDRLTNLLRNQRTDGSGDLIFERKSVYKHGSRSVVDQGFLIISDVKAVEDLVRELVDTSAKNEA